jgi:hypothetical protein
MYNMSSLHKYNYKSLINLNKIKSLFTTVEGSSLNLSVARDSVWHLAWLNIYRIYKYIVSDRQH